MSLPCDFKTSFRLHYFVKKIMSVKFAEKYKKRKRDFISFPFSGIWFKERGFIFGIENYYFERAL